MLAHNLPPNTKIVATLGPASGSPEIIGRLIEAGVTVFRLNLSHGTQEEHAARLRVLRAREADLGATVAVLLDLQGPKIRLGTFAGGGCVLGEGAMFTITTEPVEGTAERASTSYTGFARDVRPGDRVLLADGTVELRVLETDGTDVRSVVVFGGEISDRKGINLPGVHVNTPSLTRKDMADLRFGLEAGVDLIGLSFVREREDVMRLRLLLEDQGARLPIVAKIEKPEGWSNLDAILEEADGVMVARGDLGVEMALEKVPFIQKSIIERARERGRFVITATQMLESMVREPLPTRAEVSDVANAIFDGTDAVMLSAETSLGKHPVEAARMMARIALEAESSLRPAAALEPARAAGAGEAEIVAVAACQAALAARAAAIVVFTTSGRSARLVARQRPRVPVCAFTTEPAVARQLAVIYGVRPVQARRLDSTDEMVAQMDAVLLELGWLKAGDTVVFVSGQPIGRAGTTNMMKLHRVGESR